VLACQEAHVLVLEAFDDVAELAQAPPPLLRIVGGVRESPVKTMKSGSKFRLFTAATLLQRAAGVRVHDRPVNPSACRKAG